MSMLPYQQGDVVSWDDQTGVVEEVRGDRVVVLTMDGMLHITTHAKLRERQPKRPAA